MKMKLIASAPSKRFDAPKQLCTDGRGGWVFSQVNVDRSIADREDYWLVFFLGVLVEDANENDYVESTRITARMNGQTIGTDTLDWKRPNPMWGYLDGNTIFEWSQPIMMQPTDDGMILFSIESKLSSQSDWHSVSGNAYCRIKLTDESELEDRWVSSGSFTLKALLRKSVWGLANRNKG